MQPPSPHQFAPPYVDYTAVVDEGSFDQHRATSPVVHLSRVEWEHVASFLHVDGVLALRSVSRQFYRTASDPRIWQHLLGRDKLGCIDRRRRAEDEEEDSWRALSSPIGRKVGRRRCLREEYGAARFAAWRVFLLFPDAGAGLTPNRQRMLWQQLAPTDRRDAAALHDYAVGSDAVAATKNIAAGRLWKSIVNVAVVCGLTSVFKEKISFETRHGTVTIRFNIDTPIWGFQRVPFALVERPVVRHALAEACRVQAIPAPMRLPLLTTAGVMVALSAFQASRRMPKVRNAALKSSAMLRHRVVCYAVYRCMNIYTEACVSGLGSIVAGNPALAVIVALPITLLLAPSPDAVALRHVREIQHARRLDLIHAARAQGDTDFDVRAQDVRLTAAEVAQTQSRMRAVWTKSMVLTSVTLATVVLSAWKANSAASWLRSTVLALPLPQRAVDAVAVIPSGNLAWSAAWTLMVAVIRCRSASFDESLDVYKDGLATPFAPDESPTTAEEFVARSAEDRECAKAHGAYLFVDEVIGSVAELSMRAAGCPVWLGVTFRTAVAAIQSATEMYVARNVSSVY